MPQVEDKMYIDYAEDETPNYTDEVWYQKIMSMYQSEKEYEKF